MSVAPSRARRSGAWVKVKNHQHQLFVVGGWLQRENAMSPAVGALLLGYYREGVLVFAGRAGSGLTDALSVQLARDLGADARASSPFAADAAMPPEAHFCEPRLVADVTFLEWTGDGLLRQPAIKGLRPDIDPAGVGRE